MFSTVNLRELKLFVIRGHFGPVSCYRYLRSTVVLIATGVPCGHHISKALWTSQQQSLVDITAAQKIFSVILNQTNVTTD